MCSGYSSLAIKRIELSIAYAVWAGVVLTSIIGISFFRETMTPVKLGSIGLICLGVANLIFHSPISQVTNMGVWFALPFLSSECETRHGLNP